ncbi:MAG: gliding motility-associated C-terminal domain-containing protein [Crocinitomicaceae bacterium]|nr:gliding motility-associated C-terminal domain-containing protein [Crocinitomicaceae bacterium]
MPGYKNRSYCIVLLVLLFSVNAMAQLDTKHYIPPLHARDLAGTHYLVLGTPVTTSFNVTVQDGSGNVITTIPISNGASNTTNIGSGYSSPFLVDQGLLNLPLTNGSGKGLILTAPQPFYANIRVKVSNQAASLTSKGQDAATGTDFRVGHLYNNAGLSSVKSSSFSFMATEDNTTVTVSNIKPGVVLNGVAPGTTTFNVQLNAGDSYVASAYMDQSGASNNTNGLNGTHITSNKDIVVNCGSWLGGNAIYGTSPNGPIETGRDIGIDQIVPIDVIGDEYVLIKGFGIDNERTIVVASQDNTDVFINGTTLVATLQAGDFHVIEGTSFSGNGNLYLTSSAPVYVTQSTNGESGTSADNERHAGMNFIPPVKCTGEKAVTLPDVSFLGQAYINIVADAGAVITANGNQLTGASAIPGTSDYVTYSISGYAGDVNIVSTLPVRVSLINRSTNIGAAGYFSGFSKEVNLNASYINNGVQSTGDIAEGCGTALISIERLSIYANDPVTINLSTSGTAQEGVDYTSVPNQVTLAAGQTQAIFNVDALFDNILEGSETVTITLSVAGNYCLEDEITFEIFDVSEPSVSLSDANVVCPGEELTLTPMVDGGLSPYSFVWSTGDTTESITVAPFSTESYTVTVTDACTQSNVDATATVVVPDNPLFVFAGIDQTVLCPYTPTTLVVEAIGGNPDYSYTWNANGVEIGIGNTISTAPPSTTDYIVEVVDNCGVSNFDTVRITVTTPLMDLEVNEDRLVCPFEETELWCQVSGGLPPFNYYWNHSGETSSSVTVAPGYSTTYTVSVSDACNTYTVEGYPFVEIVQPIADFSFLSTTTVEGLPVYFENNSVGGVIWDWDLGNGEYSTLFSPGTTYETAGTYLVTLIATNEMGCVDTISKPMTILHEYWFYAPNTFTPDGNEFNNAYSISVIGAVSFDFKIFDRWGELIFESQDPNFSWDGTYNGNYIQDGVLVYVATVVDENGETHEYTGHISLLR